MPRRNNPLKLPATFGRRRFRWVAKPLAVALDGVVLGPADPIGFRTGSLGRRRGDRLRLRIGEHYALAQVTLTVLILGSKELPPEPELGLGTR